MSVNKTYPVRVVSLYSMTNQNSEGYFHAGSATGVATRISGFIGESNPSWKRIIQSGGDASTDFTACDISFNSEPGSARIDYTYIGGVSHHTESGHALLTGDLAQYRHTGVDLSLDDGFDGATFNRLKIKFLNKLYGEINTFSTGTFIGELTETLHLIKNPAQALRKGLSSYLSTLESGRGIRGTKPRKKFAARTWLEYSYGWAPLVNDIASASKAMKQLLDGRPPTSRVSAILEFESASSGTDGTKNYNAIGDANFSFDIFFDYSRRESQRILGAARINPPGSSVVGRTLGLNPLRDFIPTAWELIPYSFLVDYFSNVGEVLTACQVMPSDVAFAIHQVRTESAYNIGGIYRTDLALAGFGPPYTSRSTSGNFGHSQWRKRSYRRRRNFGLFDFSLIPSLKIPGLGTKWLNMGALAAQHNKLKPFF